MHLFPPSLRFRNKPRIETTERVDGTVGFKEPTKGVNK
jgi:hypothetical protein